MMCANKREFQTSRNEKIVLETLYTPITMYERELELEAERFFEEVLSNTACPAFNEALYNKLKQHYTQDI